MSAPAVSPDVFVADIARSMYACDDVEIDPRPEVRLTEDGAWVQAWVYVPADEMTS